jgi:hypothetical protein
MRMTSHKEFDINRTRRGTAAVGCVAFIASAAVACGTATNLSAGGKVGQAFEKLGEQKALTMSVGFDGTQAQIWSAMKGEDDFTQDNAKMLADLDVDLSMSADQALKQAKTGSVAVTVSAGGDSSLLEVRSLDGKKLYVKADLKQLMTLGSSAGAGSAEDKAALKDFQSMLDQADKLPSTYKSVKSLLAGDWVSIDPASFKELSKEFGAGTNTGTDALDTATQQKIAKALTKAIGSNATFKDAGSKNGADHVTVTVPAAKTAKALAKALKPYKDDLPDGLDPADLKDVPNKNITLDVAIKDGALSGITVDVAQFDKKVKGTLPLTIGFAADAKPVEAPAGATALDPKDVMGALMRLMMGSGATA